MLKYCWFGDAICLFSLNIQLLHETLNNFNSWFTYSVFYNVNVNVLFIKSEIYEQIFKGFQYK